MSLTGEFLFSPKCSMRSVGSKTHLLVSSYWQLAVWETAAGSVAQEHDIVIPTFQRSTQLWPEDSGHILTEFLHKSTNDSKNTVCIVECNYVFREIHCWNTSVVSVKRRVINGDWWRKRINVTSHALHIEIDAAMSYSLPIPHLVVRHHTTM